MLINVTELTDEQILYLRMTNTYNFIFDGRVSTNNVTAYLLKIKCHSKIIEKHFIELPDGLYVLFFLRNDNSGYIVFTNRSIINANGFIPLILDGKFTHIYKIDTGIRLECGWFHIEKRGF